MKCDGQNFLSFWAAFCHFTSLTTRKFWKTKKNAWSIFILNKCTINDNQIMYVSWDIECDRQNFFVILDHFLPFFSPNNSKYQHFEKTKKTSGDIIILTSVPKIRIICYTVPQIWRVTDIIIFYFGLLFPLLPSPPLPLTAWKMKISK